LDIDSPVEVLATMELATPALARPLPEGQAPPPAFATQRRPLEDGQTLFQLDIPANAPSGLIVPRLTLEDAQPLMPSGQTRGDLFLRPLRIEAAPAGTAVTGLNEDAALDVAATDMLVHEEQVLEGRLAWWTGRPLGANYHFSWRLQDANGLVLAQLDDQPGHGFQPSVGWPIAQPVYDWLALQLPPQLSGPGPYPLVMRLYDSVSGEEVLVRRLGEVVEDGEGVVYRPATPQFDLPEHSVPLTADFLAGGEPVIRLHGYQINQSTDTVSLTLYWEALEDGTADYTRFVHLLDPATENIAAQVDGLPQGNSYPTGQWTQGEIITDSVAFDLSQLPLGAYRIATGFYNPAGDLPRLSVTGSDGLLPDNRVTLPDMITVP
jgi:hypothetical protein